MRKNKNTIQTVIHFSRWSRKQFAVFCSVGKQVIISHLKAELSDASLQKSKKSFFSLFGNSILTEISDSTDKEPKDSPQELIPVFICVSKSPYPRYFKRYFKNIFFPVTTCEVSARSLCWETSQVVFINNIIR
ncbi:MAG: hypothetical protein A2275_00245 [Bacteroidetes bacterium RIFOXYA12_FULL_35_11]|nr:MAG: hypothetical protein A2X01_20600 [Bacteroidetes bacterium GWF2_35_48]OFY83574.1 MAG: hypothetical protein A2275_00245 [Bacteroidetes bacterium RIFOXYA12_FULL_35_11]OFY95868.1 MAG: hypothetical protein A2491_09870 [Bacteroidetes bacterium RIFOXYC12_FULL_35_7]OFY97557.1 MAG: hypothetical protein A2309_12745 [Bacteroidetes bacterium RIFOXYB2_FULL_35_7]HBX51764.1 hypothetical protein [Bacteroidales bacterium]